MKCFRCGARDGIRTRDPNLGKVVLYQLSYSRMLYISCKELTVISSENSDANILLIFLSPKINSKKSDETCALKSISF